MEPQVLMRAAIAEARRAFEAGEVPIGCVIACGGEIISKAYNLVETRSDPTAHAEVLAIQHACQAIKNWRLTDATLCVTLEPCAMCVGAMKLARMPRVVFGAGDSRFGAGGTVVNLFAEERLGPVPEVIAGVMRDECALLLKEFFRTRREMSG